VATAQELLINRFMTRATIGRRDPGIDDEPVMVCSLLALCNLVAVETIKTFGGVSTHFELVNH